MLHYVFGGGALAAGAIFMAGARHKTPVRNKLFTLGSVCIITGLILFRV